uniref:Uncharacterized protein n=1 Tax=Triticum urartu TaxID=4572 RepID=A0A8R7V781_TRIUA
MSFIEYYRFKTRNNLLLPPTCKNAFTENASPSSCFSAIRPSSIRVSFVELSIVVGKHIPNSLVTKEPAQQT